MNSTCIFCRIVAGEIPSTKIAETEFAIAIRDIAPEAPVHVLIIPKAHTDSLNETSDGVLLGNVLLLAAQIARDEGVADSGYRTVINTRSDGGQSVSHLHVHVVGGRALGWPPG